MNIHREERPWGWFETIDEGDDYKVKKLFVNPKSRFSLQYHNHREEHWTIVEGSGIITLDDDTLADYYEVVVKPGDHYYIPIKSVHRLSGGDKGVLFIEVQRGICLPDDIVRLEDDYGREGTTE